MKNSELRALSLEELNKKLIVEKENLEKLIKSLPLDKTQQKNAVSHASLQYVFDKMGIR